MPSMTGSGGSELCPLFVLLYRYARAGRLLGFVKGQAGFSGVLFRSILLIDFDLDLARGGWLIFRDVANLSVPASNMPVRCPGKFHTHCLERVNFQEN